MNTNSELFTCVTNAGAGAIVGGVIGMLLLPPLGVLIGAEIGGLVGAHALPRR